MRSDLQPCDFCQPNQIHDGYTAHGYVSPRPGLHGALLFAYRPYTLHERNVVARKVAAAEKATPGSGTKLMASAIARQLVDWDLIDRGQPVSISTETVGRLPHDVFLAAWGIVLGTRASDLPDTPERTDVDVDLEAELEAELSGVSDEKN